MLVTAAKKFITRSRSHSECGDANFGLDSGGDGTDAEEEDDDGVAFLPNSALKGKEAIDKCFD